MSVNPSILGFAILREGNKLLRGAVLENQINQDDELIWISEFISTAWKIFF